MSSPYRNGKTSGLSTVALAVVAVVVIAGLGGAIFFVLPSLSSDDPTQASTPSAPSQPSTPSAPSQPSTPIAPSEPPPQPEARVLGDPENCSGFVTQAEIESASGISGLLWIVEPPRESASRDADLSKICTASYVSNDLPVKALSVTVMTMVSEEAALKRLTAEAESFKEGGKKEGGIGGMFTGNIQIFRGIVGEESFMAIVNADGIGAVAVVKSGIYILIFTSSGAGADAIIDPEQLDGLIEVAVERLPN